MLKHILSAVQKHAAAEYPRECCGLIIRSGRSQRYVPCENTAADAGEEFRIAPEAYAEAEDQGEIVAVVHSHPDATSRPSAADVAMCNASGLTWHILSWPEGDLRTIEPVDQVPLLGRAFVHGVQDCWQVCSDWYQREWGIEFPHFERADGWWERADGPSLYEQQFEGAGFIRVDRPQRGDTIVMAVGAPRTRITPGSTWRTTHHYLARMCSTSALAPSCCTTSTAGHQKLSCSAGHGSTGHALCCVIGTQNEAA